VEGPIIFITLINSSSFSLKFEATGEPDNNNLQKYQHFHSTDKNGTFKYPDGKYYSGPEILTIVIQPQEEEKNNPTKIHLEEMDIQDKLPAFIPDVTLFFGSKIIKSFYGCIQDNLNFFFLGLKNNKIKRFCGSMKDEVSEELSGDQEGIIVVFKSDILGDGKGFRFRWDSSE
jgi:hypothetical protein